MSAMPGFSAPFQVNSFPLNLPTRLWVGSGCVLLPKAPTLKAFSYTYSRGILGF